MKHRIFALTAIGFAASALLAPPARAGTTPVYVFGDSLSDTGNLAETLFGANFINPSSFHDSFTNGPVAAELVAEHYGVRADPSLWATGFADIHSLFGGGFTPGTNYAVAGATATDRGSLFFNLDLPEQVAAFTARTGGAGHAPANAIYYMLIGGNDVRTAAHALNTGFVTSGVNSELAQIQALITDGAKSILVTNVPDVGLIPEFTTGPGAQAVAAHNDSVIYNSNLVAGVNALRALNAGVTIGYFDLFSFNNNLIANAAALGFTNTTDACYTNDITTFTAATDNPLCGAIGVNGAANIAQFIYWDKIHPTARVQALAAIGQENVLPEPMTIAVLSVGLLGLAAVRRRARRL